ncbi:MAG: TrkA C-terminal domain-containing protein [Phycisphaerae bacterium]
MFLIFVFTLAVSFIVVRIGAVAFQLTGLEWSLAKFQSLSCFTGTGFTTKEAELITGIPQRRKIASILMVLGNAGLVVLIASFASTLMPKETALSNLLMKRFLPLPLADSAVVLLNRTLLAAGVIIVYKIFTNNMLTLKLTDYMRAKIVKRQFFSRVSFEELLLATGGYGVSKVTVRRESPVLNKKLSESNLRENGINVLAISRGKETLANPSAQTDIREADELVCFGKLEDIRKHLCPNTEKYPDKN